MLPRVEGEGQSVRLVTETRSRYEPVKLLGAGGMGEVLLVNDQDIARSVAVKRLLPDKNDPARLARFVDEVRTVGKLEHPNIVPIHDVGVDADGRYFFVMKYVEGETLESIIERLRRGDAGYHQTYTLERRLEIFVSVLNALSYAHDNGIVHRDVKPANVMVGHYGEVMLMDWGIAKPIAASRDLAGSADATLESDRGDARGRLYATRVGAIIGTPAYMSPEQARGDNNRIDERSDLYSATALFHELVSLHHYLEKKTTHDAMLKAILSDEVTLESVVAGSQAHGVQMPLELVHFIVKGLAKDPSQRHQSAGEMAAHLQCVLEGRFDVYCHVTLIKRVLRESARLLDTHPRLITIALLGMIAAVLFSVVQVALLVAA